MKVPVSWLKEYVEIDASAQEIADKLTFSGIEVEGIEVLGEKLGGIVAAEIRAIDAHPDADKLRLCRVFDGKEEVDVVCGADNFEVGDIAAFAGVGVTLPNGMPIKKAKIRGQVSLGMLCAEDELGLSDDHTGILLLPADTEPGSCVADVLGLPETVLELEITWNRPDCLSIIGIARELAALFGKELKKPAVDFEERGEPVEKYTKVDIEDPEGCPRYTGRVLTKVKLGDSPDWMQRRLQASGVRAINNIVDITNYVMLECGHPLHAFDYNLLKDHHIIVRRAKAGELMVTLDGEKHELTPDALVIADSGRAVALAGIMGGADSEIGDATGEVLLESATFAAPVIAKTAARLGLRTESSHRFERGVDAATVEWASRRAASLMVKYAGATAAQGVIDVFPAPPVERSLECRRQRICDLLGIDIGEDEIIGILESLEFKVVERKDGNYVVQVPSFRGDITLEADLIEEVARMHGLDEIPALAPGARIVPDVRDTHTRAILECRSHLVGLGLTEIMNYSFVSEQLLNSIAGDDAESRVALPNPVSSDYAIMRNSLLPQMLDTLGRNRARQIMDAAFFEIGRIFIKNKKGAIGEDTRLSIGLMGMAGGVGLRGKKSVAPEEMFLRIKGLAEALFDAQGVDDYGFTPVRREFLEDGWAVECRVDGRGIGVMGLVKAATRHKWRMADPVAVVEVSLEGLLAHFCDLPALKPIPSYPSVSRDIAMLVDGSVKHEDIVRVIMANAPGELTVVELFDIFQGEGIEQGKKSLAYSLKYRSLERTLTDAEANRHHEAIKTSLRNELKVEIREG